MRLNTHGFAPFLLIVFVTRTINCTHILGLAQFAALRQLRHRDTQTGVVYLPLIACLALAIFKCDCFAAAVENVINESWSKDNACNVYLKTLKIKFQFWVEAPRKKNNYVHFDVTRLKVTKRANRCCNETSDFS